MKKLKAKFSNCYRSKAGNTVFVYHVSGTPDNMAAYKAAAGDNLRVDEVSKAVLYFTTNWNGNNIDLVITSNNNIVTDTSATDKLVAVVNKSSGILQDKLAGLVAAHILGGLIGTPAVATAPVEVPAETPAPVPTPEPEPTTATL